MTRSQKLNPYTLLIELARDSERKSLVRIIAEVLYLYLVYREVPHHYFSRYLFKKGATNIRNYLPNKFLYSLKRKFNENEVRSVLDNKLHFDFYYRQFTIPLPSILMYNHRRNFVLDKQQFEINTLEEFTKLLKKLFERSAADSLFVKKTYWSYEGNHVYKLYADDVAGNPGLMQALFFEVVQSGFLFQQTIKQHSEMNKLNSSCLNTIRLDTFIDHSGNISVMSAYLKTNMRNNYIDNEESGGCEIPVDLESGRLRKYGHFTIQYNGVKLPTEHPVSKTRFENFQIPYFEQAKELAVKAAGYMPGLRLVGWDVAIDENGPVLIEGNSDYGIPASDLAYGGYRANPVFQKVLEEIRFR